MDLRQSCLAIVCCSLSLLVASAAVAGDYLLYQPREVGAQQAVPAPPSGILVKKIPIRRGDTLSGISAKMSGKGTYYPQILLFNQINNPNRIYAGKSLYVPVTRSEKAETAQPKAKHRSAARTVRHSASARAKHLRHTRNTSRHSRHAVTFDNGQPLFVKGVSAYRRGECREAIAIFDTFLRRYPHSPFAAEAGLYKADCYLTLSGR